MAEKKMIGDVMSTEFDWSYQHEVQGDVNANKGGHYYTR